MTEKNIKKRQKYTKTAATITIGGSKMKIYIYSTPTETTTD